MASTPDAPSCSFGSTFAPTSHHTVTVHRTQAPCAFTPTTVGDRHVDRSQAFDEVPVRRKRKQAIADRRRVWQHSSS